MRKDDKTDHIISMIGSVLLMIAICVSIMGNFRNMISKLLLDPEAKCRTEVAAKDNCHCFEFIGR